MARRYRLQEVSWRSHAAAIRRLRAEVFTREQSVPEALEWDEWDACSRYVLATAGGNTPVGTGRLNPSGQIGRMAVLRDWRGIGIGSAMLVRLVSMAREGGFTEVFLHAQCHAVDFYGKHGFIARGPEFDEAGIRHRLMVRGL